MIEGRIAITGANGHLGRRLLSRLPNARAVVRSAAAAEQIAAGHPGADTVIVDYTDATAMKRAVEGCSAVIHLVGILKETRTNRYVDAHEATCTALAAAARASGVQQISYLSIIGSHGRAANACLASKGRAEEILLASGTRTVVLQVPMVLGESDFASRALAARAGKKRCFVLRAESREQPIYAGDVIDGIVAAFNADLPPGSLAIAGPESVTRAELTRRAARVLGTNPQIVSLPLGLGMIAAWFLERVSANPPVTRAMLEVLDHDDDIEAEHAARVLGIRLTPLDEMLSMVLKESST